MNQKIIYCSDTAVLPDQLLSAGFFHEDLDENGKTIKRPHLPVETEGVSVDRDGKRLTCVLVTPEQENPVNAVDCLSVLGSYEEIFASPQRLAIYDSVYDRSPHEWEDPETGETVTVTPPDRFAAFALPEPDPDAEKERVKQQRQAMLESTTQIVMAHNEQKELGRQPDMSDEQYRQTLQYREQLRKML